MTMREFTHKHLSDLTVAFVGDARFRQCRALAAIGAAKVGLDMRIASPRALWPPDAFMVGISMHSPTTTGATLKLTETVAGAVKGADFVYTDVWLSMGEPDEAPVGRSHRRC